MAEQKQSMKSILNASKYKVKTAYADYHTQQALNQYDENGFGAGKVVFMPALIKDYGYVNTAFAGEIGSAEPDYDRPLAEFNVVPNAAGIPEIKIKPLDEYGAALQVWNEALSRASGNPVKAQKEIATAGIVNSQTIDVTKSLNILDRVLGLQVRNFFLQQTVTMVPSPNLVFTVDEYAEGAVQEKVPELDEPQLITHTETRVTNVLYKNIGHIAISEEADMKGSHPTMQLRQEKTLKDLARVINNQIATILATATDVAGADWGATSGTPPDSSNNPLDDIQPVITIIEGNGFNVDYIAGHDAPVTKLLTNKFVRGRGNENIGTNVLQANNLGENGLPPIIKDQALVSTTAIVASKDAVWLGQGPTAVAAYVNDQAGYKGWLAKQWWFPYLAQAGAIRELTGVAS